MKCPTIRILHTLLLAVICGAALAAAQPIETATAQRLIDLTLEQALRLAESNHPELAESRALIDAAAGSARHAGRFPNPQAIAGMEEAGRSTRDADYLAGVSQQIPLGGRLGRARSAAQFDRDREAAQMDVTRAKLRQRVRSAFATALYQSQAAQTQASIAESLNKTASIARSRLEAGDATPDEVARAEMELLRGQLEAQRSCALQEQSFAALAAALGISETEIASLAGDLTAAFDVRAIESLAAALTNHPSLLLGTSDIRAQAVRVDLARAERIPDLNVELLYRRVQSERRDAFDLVVSIPIPLFDRNQGKIQSARAELDAARARARATELELQSSLQQSHSGLKIALAHSQLLENEILPRAEAILKTAEARYSAGDISLVETLLIRRDYAEVQLARLETLREVMQAWAGLQPFMR